MNLKSINHIEGHTCLVFHPQKISEESFAILAASRDWSVYNSPDTTFVGVLLNILKREFGKEFNLELQPETVTRVGGSVSGNDQSNTTRMELYLGVKQEFVVWFTFDKKQNVITEETLLGEGGTVVDISDLVQAIRILKAAQRNGDHTPAMNEMIAKLEGSYEKKPGHGRYVLRICFSTSGNNILYKVCEI
jgi:hypothetical protein